MTAGSADNRALKYADIASWVGAPATRAEIREHKSGIVAELTAEALRYEYQERAGIGEFDGGTSRAAAEREVIRGHALA